MAKRRLVLEGVHSKIRLVNKISISEEIASQIMNLIAMGQLKPGQRLPSERDLCKAFGASRSSLREALRCLSIIGLLEANLGEGTSVASDGEKFLAKILEWRLISEKHDIENLLEVRIGLEGIAAANVARSATNETVAKLQAILERMRDALSDPKQFTALDLEFHVAIAQASGNALLVDLVMMIRSQIAHGVARVLKLEHAIPLSYDEHMRVLQAIRKRDQVAAREAMQAHLKAALLRHRNATAGLKPTSPLKRGRGVPLSLEANLVVIQ